MSDRETRQRQLAEAQERLGVRFPPKFTAAFLDGVDLPNQAPVGLWEHIELLHWAGDDEESEAPDGVGFPEEGDPDFYCLIQNADGALSEIIHLFSFEKQSYDPVLPHLGADPKKVDLAALKRESPLHAPPAMADDVNWEALLLDVLVERELIEFRPINRPYVTRLLGHARPNSFDEAALKKSTKIVVELLEDADIIEDFFFDEDELYAILQAMVA